jgi:hypothetical protein
MPKNLLIGRTSVNLRACDSADHRPRKRPNDRYTAKQKSQQPEAGTVRSNLMR